MLTTYPTLDKCTVALQSISWFRVVLDEMQEVRSSTTELARKCERLSCGRRWMVSGTPLYSSLADLRGELNFLRVSPFGAGHEDGFWQHVIAQPWAARSESALDAIELLLSHLMLRRSKSQTDTNGVSILDLPPKTMVRQPVVQQPSERAAYACLEQLVTAEVLRTRALSAADEPAVAAAAAAFGRASREAAQRLRLLKSGLRLLREGAVAMQLLGGGAGCSEQLAPINEIARAQIQARGTGGAGGAAGEAPRFAIERRLTPAAALMHLASAERDVGRNAFGSRLHNPQVPFLSLDPFLPYVRDHSSHISP